MTARVRPADRPAPESAVPPQSPADAPASRWERGAGPAGGSALIVDEEFKALLPALTPDQREGLERSILSDGVLSPLVVWEEEGILLDGHNRLEIVLREGLPCPTRTVKLASREAAVEWIFAHQRDRRNLTPDQLALVMGRHYNRVKRPGGREWRSVALPQNVEGTGSAVDRLSKEYGVSDMTIERAGKFAAAVETLKAVDPEIEQKVVTGKGPTRKAVIAAAEAEPEEAKAILAGSKPEPKRPSSIERQKHTQPCEAMSIARRAASVLNEIRNDDTQKAEAFAFVRRWLDAHEA